jgi:DNA primase
MSRFSRDTIERVKEAADIVEIVSPYTDLRRSGQRFTGLCPFHEERTPSFSVNPQDKLYHCFGCGEGGDVFKFVEEKEGLGFSEAVEALAERYGVEIEREAEDPRAEAARRRRARLYEALERTSAFYASYLWEAPKAAKARAYLSERGLGEEVLREFGIGFAPSAWDQVLVRGQRAGFSVEELRDAGLIQRGRQGGHYDRFRSRITFPIRDQRGRAVGLGARALGDSVPKYLNSPEGELYRKSETLYGVDRARGAIARADHAIVVEGYTDVLALHQAGITEAVAVMGTAITPEQLKILSGVTESVVLAMDADRAGADAMIRAQRVAGSRRMTIRVAPMPQDTDPADMVRDGAVDRFRDLVEAAIDLPSFRVRTTLDRADLGTLPGRERALAELAPVLAAMGEAVGRDELVREAADRLDTDPSLVSERVRAAVEAGDEGGEAAKRTARGGEDGAARSASSQPHRALTPRELRERALLAMCIADPGRGREYLERLSEDHLSPTAGRALVWLREHLDDPISGLPRGDEELVSFVTQLVMSSEHEPPSQGAMELNFMLLELHRLETRIAEAQRSGDYERGSELSRERADLTARIAHADRLGA